MKKITYQETRAELKKRCRNIKYFNKQFFDSYCKCKKMTVENVKNGIDDSYYMDGENFPRFESWRPMYESKLYQENSTVYCEFLSVVYGRI